MLQKLTLWFVVAALLFSLALPVYSTARAQGPDGYTTYQLNLRAGPGPTYDIVTVLAGNTGLYFEGRTADLAWLLVRTEDGVYRGWVAALYVVLRDGYGSINHVPLSDEIVALQPAVSAADPAAGQAAVDTGAVTISGLDIDADTAALLDSIPIVSGIGPRAYEIFQHGQQLGNSRSVFTQVGECNTQSTAFMIPFGSGLYDLGAYGNLRVTIAFFQTPVGTVSNSFWYKGVAMTTGLTSAAVVDPNFGNPALCTAGQSLLECEYERSKPVVALIHLGLYDVYWLNAASFEQSMRRIIDISIDYGVIPVLTTFPTAPGDAANWPNTAEQRYQNRAVFNRTIIALGQEYGVPVLNLWKATNGIAGHGLKPGDYQHLRESANANYPALFNGEQNVYGFTMWNLAALQMLDALRANVLGG
ncbi:MAG: SH3 domain-containing protein [Anaerolineae bacterium]|nr:SH3 domain-containing protein [Anaerolineae bacterium]